MVRDCEDDTLLCLLKMEAASPRGTTHETTTTSDRMLRCMGCAARIYIVLVGVLLCILAFVLLLVGSGSLSLVGNDNPLSSAIPDWPDSWSLIIFGTVGTGFSIAKCIAGISGSWRGCLFNNATIICNSALALICMIVLMGFVFNGYHLISDSAWAVIRNEATSTTGQIITPSGANASDATLIDVVATICSPSFLHTAVLVLVLLLALSLLLEYLLLCKDVDGRQPDARRAAVEMHVVHHHHYGQPPPRGSLASKDQTALTVATDERTCASSI